MMSTDGTTTESSTLKEMCIRDRLRIDHFRGFDEYYAIPYGHPTAKHGVWEKGPGIELFQAIWEAIGKAEDVYKRQERNR